MIHPTIKLTISGVSRKTNTCQDVMELLQRQLDESLSRLRKRQLASGMDQRKAESTTQNTGTNTLSQKQLKTSQKFVRFVARTISRLSSTLSSLNIVTKTARPVHCVSVEKQHYLTDVYCITVPTTESFCIEGGIVVHNCADEARYVCMSRPLTNLKPKTTVIHTDVWGRPAQTEQNWKTA